VKRTAVVVLLICGLLGWGSAAHADLMFTVHQAEVIDPDDGQTFQTPSYVVFEAEHTGKLERDPDDPTGGLSWHVKLIRQDNLGDHLLSEHQGYEYVEGIDFQWWDWTDGSYPYPPMNATHWAKASTWQEFEYGSPPQSLQPHVNPTWDNNTYYLKW